MKVVYANGKEGNLPENQGRNLTIKGRFSKEDWEDLKLEMEILGIIKFEDPFLKFLGADLTSIEYVENQIVSHSN